MAWPRSTLARDLRHERNVALKVVKPELAAVVGAERFLAEIRTTANLQHPHILPLHDSGEAHGLLFYVMPHVEGESLRERLAREHQLAVEAAVRIATNVAEALDYAHRHGVIHRDIKPANILLQDGKPVVSDFGIALAVSAGGAGRLTETGLSLGTPHYMSPEQATGDVRVGPATDLGGGARALRNARGRAAVHGEHAAGGAGLDHHGGGGFGNGGAALRAAARGRGDPTGAREGAGGPVQRCGGDGEGAQGGWGSDIPPPGRSAGRPLGCLPGSIAGPGRA